jgi:2'-5' RNA ligase
MRTLRRHDRERLKELAAGRRAFDFRLDAIATFPDVVYLAPESSDRFRELTEALVARWPDRLPYAGAFAEVIPHLTLRVGEDLSAAEQQSLEQLLPIAARAREILVVRPGTRRWRVLYRAPLAAATSE